VASTPAFAMRDPIRYDKAPTNGGRMTERTKARTGGQLLVDALKVHGVDLAFCVPGESYLAVLDALYDARNSIRLVTCRQEGGAANMAEAYGKLTGRPGICFVTRGPGATNASIGVHTAFQDSTPMILFIGQVASDQAEREAFQEVDYRRMFAPLAKWAAQIDNPARVPELVSQAFHRAVAGRPGPVVIALPEDMLTATANVADTGPYKTVRPHPGPDELQAMRDLLAKAERPFLLLGGGGWDAAAVRDITAFAEANDLPAGVSFRCQDLIDNTHKNYAGHVGIGPHPALAAQVKEADVLLVVGARLGEMTTSGYTLLEVPVPRQTLIHVHAGAEELGRVYQPALAINAGMAPFAAAARALPPVDPSRWAARTAQAHKDYLATLEHEGHAGPVQMPAVMKFLRGRLPPDAILTNDADRACRRLDLASLLIRPLGPVILPTRPNPTS
jgi:acetolactate synthase-1/2/3 large subunit